MKTEALSDRDKKALFELDNFDVPKYLSLYVADIDWTKSLAHLRNLPIDMGEKWKRIAFTICLPLYEPTPFKNTDVSNIFNWCFKWQQYNSRFWIEELVEIYKEDQRIETIRKDCLDLGIVYPLQYNPTTRQAFNWLMDAAKDSEAVMIALTGKSDSIATDKLQNLVYVYGGNVVCSIFNKPEYGGRIKRLPNWRTGYFFERLINEVYSSRELIDIKTHEINKLISSGTNLIRYLTKE